MDWWYITLIIGFTQGLFLVVVLFTWSNKNKYANRFLALLIIGVTSNIAFEISALSGTPFIKLFLRILSIPSTLLIGPSLFFYIKKIISLEAINKMKVVFHYLPFLFLFLLLFIFEWQFGLISTQSTGITQILIPLIVLLKFFHISFYFFSSFLILREFSNKREVAFINESKRVIKWLMFLLITFILLVFLSGVYFVFAKFLDTVLSFGDSKFIVIFLVIIIYCIGFMSIRYPIIVFFERGKYVVSEVAKYETSSLKEEDIKTWKMILLDYMESEKPYLNDKLKIEDLAKILNIPSHNLSQIINQEMNISFQLFINKYRVEEFKRKVLDPKESNKTLLAIAYESGFSSKATFNRIFKTITSQTPNQYKKSHLN